MLPARKKEISELSQSVQYAAKSTSLNNKKSDSQNLQEQPVHNFNDIVLICQKCQKEFAYSAEEQRRKYNEALRNPDFKNLPPKSCPDCRKKAQAEKKAKKK